MRFLAYYIEDNGFFQNQTVNFGGSDYYYFKKKDEYKLEVTRKPNKYFIPNFYGPDILTNVSAIAGANGTGKTSLLVDIIECISGTRRSSGILILEKNNTVYYFQGNKDPDTKFSNNKRWEIEPIEFTIEELTENIGSVYYSPHLDHREGVPGFDVSLDKLLYDDLEEERDTTRFTNSLNPMKLHQTNNFTRQLAYINSDISNELYKSFRLPKPLKRLKISFSVRQNFYTDSGYREFKSFDNFPSAFSEILDKILTKIEYERANRRGSQFSIAAQKERMKHYILWSILSVIVAVGERENSYLNEGRMPSDFEKSIKDLSAIETFFYFINEHWYIPPGKVKNKNSKLTPGPIPKKETTDLIKRIFDVIDRLKAKNEYQTSEFDWNNKCIYPNIEDAKDLQQLEAAFREKLKKYYQPAFISREYSTDVSPFIHFEWFDRTPSSGENAILNLFSRLLTIKQKIELLKNKHFILFLDEADAGFHPQWKKKYIDILTKISPLLFEKTGCTFQIIFTTHDPLSLSDILNYNIIYLDQKKGTGSKEICTLLNEEERPTNSFAANISDLLSNSFFIQEGLIGDFSRNKIKEAIKWLNSKKDEEKAQYFEKLILNIGEPIVRGKLSEMYDEKMHQDAQVRIIESQIEALEKQKNDIINSKKN